MEYGTKKDSKKLSQSIRNTIRQSFSRSEHYKGFLEKHRIEMKVGNRKRVFYRCNHCTNVFGKKDIQVDHIAQIGKGVYSTIDDAAYFASKVYCGYDNLQILCKPCHKVKSAAEGKDPSYDNALF